LLAPFIRANRMAGIPAPRPVVIPLFMGIWGEGSIGIQ